MISEVTVWGPGLGRVPGGPAGGGQGGGAEMPPATLRAPLFGVQGPWLSG